MIRFPIRPALLALAVILSTGCATHVPLGGIGAGRGQPIHEGLSELVMGGGVVPNISGTAPALIGADGEVVNPVLEGDELRLRYPLLDLGIALPLGDRLDLGWSFSRGLHGMGEVLRTGHVSLSLSPAIFWWSSAPPGEDERGSTLNLNLTALLSSRHVFREDEGGDPQTALEVWAGAGANRYRVDLEAGERSVTHSAWPVSVVGGASVVARPMRIGAELGGAWITQRDQPGEFAPAVRFYVSYVGPSMVRRLGR